MKIILNELFIFIFLLIFSLPQLTRAEEPILIAIIDSAIDYTHEDLKPYINSDLLKEASILDVDGKMKTLFELNLEGHKISADKINKQYYEGQVDLLNSTFALDSPQLNSRERRRHSNLVKKELDKILTGPGYEESLVATTNLLHGTHVAGQAIRGLRHTQLINFSWNPPIDRSLDEVLNASNKHQEKNYADSSIKSP